MRLPWLELGTSQAPSRSSAVGMTRISAVFVPPLLKRQLKCMKSFPKGQQGLLWCPGVPTCECTCVHVQFSSQQNRSCRPDCVGLLTWL